MTSETISQPRTHSDYTVGWVCALPKERTAATAMLDRRHVDLPKPPNDPNTYTLGSVGKHNVVIACLPKGKIGNNSAATVATWMISTFPSIKFGLMVGIGGGVPPKVRLGDVVVGTPVGRFPGVVQWDFGKAKEGGSFERTGSLNNPPSALLAALTKLETDHELTGSRIPEYLDELRQKWPRLVPKYLRSDSLKDVLFNANYAHSRKRTIDSAAIPENDDEDEEGEEDESCRFCDRAKMVKRKPRELRVFYGLIASGNQLIKDATFRDSLNKDLDCQVLCIEMEAAGLMNNFPCIVIRGICDYADSHKNKEWQEHAAAVAAAFGKELLEYVQPNDFDKERTAKDILGSVHDTLSRIEANVEIVRHKLNIEDTLEVLNWLTNIDYSTQQSDYFQRRQPGTGQWLLSSPEYLTWLQTDKQTLFCPGIPGSGKTILTSIVVNELTTRFHHDKSIGIAYLYCNFRRRDEQEADALLASLLKQLTECQPSLLSSVKDLYDKHKNNRTRPSLDEISSSLQLVVTTYSRIFIIVDALDECQETNSCRTRFLSEIFKLQDKCGANLFATSRFIPSIADNFTGCLSLEIHASNEDVQRYVIDYISKSQSKAMKECSEEIKVGIKATVEGMFLLAQLYLQSLKDRTTPRAIRNALKQFQKQAQGSNEDENLGALAQAYEDAMERIKVQSGDWKELAEKVLFWIIYAKRPLITSELQHALAVESGDSELHMDGIPYIEDMVSVCAGLVTVDKESNIIRLVHYTTQQYFEQTQKYWFPHAEINITRTCITYLSFNVFDRGFCQTDDEFEDRLGSNHFFEYAVRNWGHHAHKALTTSQALKQAVVNYLISEDKVDASSQGLFAIKKYSSHSNYSQAVPRMTGLHLTAYFGLEAVVKPLLKTGKVDADSEDGYGRTPLSYAAENGYEAIVKLLLKTGKVDADSENRYGRTPLSYAAEKGAEAIVKLLLKTGKVDADSEEGRGWTPLLYAVENGHETIVKLLLKTGKADADSGERYGGRTPFWLAAYNGYEAIAKLLLETGEVNADKRDRDGRTPLLYAVIHRYEAIIKLLLETGEVNINSKDKIGWTPLSFATKEGHETIVKLLKKSLEVGIENKGR